MGFDILHIMGFDISNDLLHYEANIMSAKASLNTLRSSKTSTQIIE